jgi:transposase
VILELARIGHGAVVVGCRYQETGTVLSIMKLLTLRDRGGRVPALPSWLTDPLWDQFAALLPDRPVYDPAHPLRCHRRRIADRIVFDKLLQVLRFGCSYEGIADSTCSATTIRDRRDEWIQLGIFAHLKQIVLEAYDRIVGLILTDIAVDGCITKAPGGGECTGRSPVDRGKQGSAPTPGRTPSASALLRTPRERHRRVLRPRRRHHHFA